MSLAVRLFLLVVASLLAILLSCLGLETLASNLIGWFLVLVGAGYLVGGSIYLWLYRGRPTIAREESNDRSFWLILPGFLVVFFGAPLEYLYLPEALPRNALMQGVGLALIGASVVLRIWVRIVLREMYTGHVQVQEGHRLVKGGPYRYVRHPGYSGFVLLALGLALGYSSLIGLVAIPALLLPGLAYRMKVEEELLTQEFGDEYRQYARTTKRIIPGLW